MGLLYQNLRNNYKIDKLIDKWTTSITIIDHLNISYYPTHYIFEKF